MLSPVKTQHVHAFETSAPTPTNTPTPTPTPSPLSVDPSPTSCNANELGGPQGCSGITIVNGPPTPIITGGSGSYTVSIIAVSADEDGGNNLTISPSFSYNPVSNQTSVPWTAPVTGTEVLTSITVSYLITVTDDDPSVDPVTVGDSCATSFSYLCT